MPRGAEYDNRLPQSHNAIEAGETKAHGTGPNTDDTVEHTKHTAPLPEGVSEMRNDEYHSGGGSRGMPASGSGKGGHDPHPRSGEGKGVGAHKAGAPGAETFRKVE